MVLVSEEVTRQLTPQVVRQVTRQVVPSGRVRGIAAAISGGFAVTWLSWGTAAVTPGLLMRLFQVSRVLAVLVSVLGVVLAVRSKADSTPMRDPAVARRYGIIVGLEFAMIFAGAIALANTVGEKWVPVWICAGVGIHFVPLSRVFNERSLMILGVMITAVAVAALGVGLTSTVAPGTVTGVGAGTCLLASGAITLIAKRFYSGRQQQHPRSLEGS